MSTRGPACPSCAHEFWCGRCGMCETCFARHGGCRCDGFDEDGVQHIGRSEPRVGDVVLDDGRLWTIESTWPIRTPFRRKDQITRVEGHGIALRALE